MPEFNTFSDIFGRGAWLMIKEMGGVEVFNASADDRSCSMMVGGQDYMVKRTHHHRWNVLAEGHWFTFDSQWELLTWIGDRL